MTNIVLPLTGLHYRADSAYWRKKVLSAIEEASQTHNLPRWTPSLTNDLPCEQEGSSISLLEKTLIVLEETDNWCGDDRSFLNGLKALIVSSKRPIVATCNHLNSEMEEVLGVLGCMDVQRVTASMQGDILSLVLHLVGKQGTLHHVLIGCSPASITNYSGLFCWRRSLDEISPRRKSFLYLMIWRLWCWQWMGIYAKSSICYSYGLWVEIGNFGGGPLRR